MPTTTTTTTKAPPRTIGRKRSRPMDMAVPEFDAAKATHKGYDEVFTADGSVRPAYQRVLPVLESQTQRDMANFRSKSRKALKDEYDLVPVPRMLTASENDTLQRGVAQRGKALREFLKDHYSGEKSYVQAGVIPADVLETILERSHEVRSQGHISPDGIGFWYGPDIIRGPDGSFHIIEDNPGYVGGMGDMKLAYDVMIHGHKGLNKVVDSPNPVQFYRDLVNSYQQRAVDGGKVVLVQYSAKEASDFEEYRLKAIFKNLGVDSVVVGATKRHKHNLDVTKDGVFLTTKGGGREKVGFIISGVEGYDLEATHPAVYDLQLANEMNELLDDRKLTRDECLQTGNTATIAEIERQIAEIEKLIEPDEQGRIDREAVQTYLQTIASTEYANPNAPEVPPSDLDELQTRGFKGLLSALQKGQVAMSNTPGAEFLGDKQTYMYVENMIRHYLQEEPIIKNLPTASFQVFDKTGAPKLNRALFDKVFDHTTKSKDAYVIKKVDGRGGDGVWVGPKMDSWESFAELAEPIQKDPGSYIVQQYTPLSQVDGHIVDLRLLADVGPNGVTVAPVPWARAVDATNGNGKVNISDAGGEQTVLVAKATDEPAAKRRRLNPASGAANRLRRHPDLAPYRLRSLHDEG